MKLDPTGLGLKSPWKGQMSAYLLCRPFEGWMAAALVCVYMCVCTTRSLCAAVPFSLSLTFKNAQIQSLTGSSDKSCIFDGWLLLIPIDCCLF